MKLGRCPTCHAHLQLEAIVQDDAGRELLALLAGLDADLGRALVSYIGLFRTPARDLANDRALRLAREVLALDAGGQRLVDALTATVESIRGKDGAPLKDHKYLSRVLENTPARCVLENTPARCVVSAPEPAPRRGPPSKHRAALDAIDG